MKIISTAFFWFWSHAINIIVIFFIYFSVNIFISVNNNNTGGILGFKKKVVNKSKKNLIVVFL